MNRTSTTEVFIIVLNWNGWKDTIECLESLQLLDHSSFRMVIVDNGSDDDSAKRIERWAVGSQFTESPHIALHRGNKPLLIVSYSRAEAEAGGTDEGETALSGSLSSRTLVLVRTGANLGFAGGCNVGIRYAIKCGAEYVWLLNNDTVVLPDCLTQMVSAIKDTKRTEAVGSVLCYFQNPEEVQAYGGGSINWWSGTTRHLTGPDKGEPDYFTGASVLLARRAIEDVGLLDESYFFYWEDIDYCQRLLRAGRKIRVASNARLLHKEGGTVSGGTIKSFDSDRFMVAGMVRFFVLHGGVRWPLAVSVRLAGMVVNRLRRSQRNRILPLLKVAGAALKDVIKEKIWLRRVEP